jgi:protein-tyrosine-phosphatase
MKDGKRVALSFVCMGNICRSPTAEAVMRHLVSEAGLAHAIALDSAGTGAWHVGEERDRRSRAVAKRRGMPISGPARQFMRGDFDRFALVLALDEDNVRELRRLASCAHTIGAQLMQSGRVLQRSKERRFDSPMDPMDMNTSALTILVVLGVLHFGGGGGYYWRNRR